MSSYSSIYRLEHPEYREKERIKDMINNRKNLIVEYDNKLRLAIENGDNVEIVKEYLDTRNTFIDDLMVLDMFYRKGKKMM